MMKRNNIEEKSTFLKEIDGNEKMLRLLSSNRLRKLIAYYDGIVEKNNETIRRLKKI